ncbi:hypothetical protein QWY15_11600 [Planococcus sp. N064]|uniref:Uncharacterized protein n=1 Tax=Planococcus liqunii TaxID=3058394 RepID=A0ABT8MSQ3_9BACL|nr:hypothetical protein [Planococcus sp. N064]MDN7227943.1 hypothetical protein [Planococcus sp. N064]
MNKLKSNSAALVMTGINPNAVLQTKQIGEARLIDPLTISKMLSSLVADITVQAINKQDLKKLVMPLEILRERLVENWAVLMDLIFSSKRLNASRI